jgi:lysozyme
MNLDLLNQELERDEGRRKYAYRDSTPEGYLTIGIGQLVDQRLGGPGLYDEVIDLQLKLFIARETVPFLEHHLPWWRNLDEVRQRALANLAFNLQNRLLGFHNFLSAMESKNFEKAADELVNSLWHKQVGKRAERLETMIRKGEA